MTTVNITNNTELSADPTDFSSVPISAATIASGADGTYTVTIAGGQSVTLMNIGTLHFSDGDVVVVGNGSVYGTIQAGVDAAAGDVRQVFILNGEYDGQVSVSGKSNLTIVGESDDGVVVQAVAGIILQNTVDATTGRAQHAIIAVSGSTDVTIRNLTVDGEDRGNSIAVSGGDFVGIAYANTSGGVDDVTITGIRDALVGGEVSGNQRGNALVVSNTGLAKTFSLTDSTITEFQKTGAIFRDMDVTVDHNEIDGNGPHSIIGQNAMQLSSGSFGDVTNNTISGIGYTGPADIVVGGVLVYDSIDGLHIDNNTFNGTGEDDVGIYLVRSSKVEASDNILNDADYGVIDIGSVGSNVNDVTDNAYANVDTDYGFYPASASGPFTVSGTEGHDDLFGTNQGDTFNGLAGNDTIDGGAGIDTVQGYDASYHVARDGGEWVVTNNTETDSLTNVERAVVDGQTTWLVDTAAELTYALANAVDGDIVQLAEGTYEGTFTVNDKQLTIFGANAGKDGDASRTVESIIKGHLVLNGTKAVNVDGVEFFADGSTGTTGHGNAAIQLHGSGDYTIENSVFFNAIVGGNTEATAVMLDTSVLGHVTIDDNLFTGNSHSGFSGANWQRGIWSDGTSTALDITGNHFHGVRSGMNLDGYDDSKVDVSGNTFETNGGVETVGTAISIGTATGSSYTGIHHNDFSGTGTDLNLRNVTDDMTVDFSGTNNTSTRTVEILAGMGDDNLTGSDGIDIIAGDGLKPGETGGAAGTFGAPGLGNDVIHALGGDDFVFGQSGNDEIHGGDGNDTIYGNADNDTIYGDADNDTIDAGDGDDIIEGGSGDDTIDGGAGIDTAVFAEDFSKLSIIKVGSTYYVSNGTDLDAVTGVENFSFNGHTANLIANPDALDQTKGPLIGSIVEAGTDEDSIPATLEVDETATAGTNVATVTASDPNLVAGDVLTFTLVDSKGNPYVGPFSITKTAEGTAVVKVNGSLDYEAATSHSFSVMVTDGHGHSVTQAVSVGVLDVNDAPVIGTVDHDLLLGTDADESFFGGDGNDYIRALGGNDILDGGKGSDFLNGGSGDDIFVLGNEHDSVADVSGTDTITSTITRSLAGYAGIENLTLLGSSNINGTGNALGNTIVGNAGANVLNGLGGADKMIGGHGNDTYVVDNGYDTVDERGGSGTDLVLSSATFNFAARAFGSVENLTLTGNGAIHGTGNALDNVITGNAAANTLNGGAGNDTLKGMAGRDTLIGDLGNDTLNGGLGNDTLNGGGGTDRLYGDAGIDTLTGGAGNDYFVFNTPGTANRDIVVDFNHVDDTFALARSVLSGLGAAVDASEFRNGTAALDANDHLIYDRTSGVLQYDSNGNALGGTSIIAVLTNHAAINHTDFVLI